MEFRASFLFFLKNKVHLPYKFLKCVNGGRISDTHFGANTLLKC